MLHIFFKSKLSIFIHMYIIWTYYCLYYCFLLYFWLNESYLTKLHKTGIIIVRQFCLVEKLALHERRKKWKITLPSSWNSITKQLLSGGAPSWTSQAKETTPCLKVSSLMSMGQNSKTSMYLMAASSTSTASLQVWMVPSGHRATRISKMLPATSQVWALQALWTGPNARRRSRSSVAPRCKAQEQDPVKRWAPKLACQRAVEFPPPVGLF